MGKTKTFSKKKNSAILRPDPWRVIQEALDTGIRYGLTRADKYRGDEDPLTDMQRDRVFNAVYDAIANEISERFIWDDGADDYD